MASKKISKITDDQSQKTNPQIDTQILLEMLRINVQQSIDKEIERMQPEINSNIENLVKDAKENVVLELNESKKELQTVKNSVLSSVALFAAFFTFVSVNVTIFTHATAVEGMALMIVMWICLMGFTYTFFLFLWDKWREPKYWAPVIIGMAINCGMLGFVKSQAVENTVKGIITPKSNN